MLTTVFLALAAAASGAALDASAEGEAVKAKILQGAAACAGGRPQDVMTHYSRDILLTYPGIPDQDYATIAAGYRELCRGSGEGTVATTVPQFEEVLVSGDMALVRIIWSTHLRGMPEGATRQLRDFQIWRRGAKGWEFIRGVHYPLRKPT